MEEIKKEEVEIKEKEEVKDQPDQPQEQPKEQEPKADNTDLKKEIGEILLNFENRIINMIKSSKSENDQEQKQETKNYDF